jgi:hypothetical protein
MKNTKTRKTKDGKVYTTAKATHFCDGCVFDDALNKLNYVGSDCHNAPNCDDIIFTKVEEEKK